MDQKPHHYSGLETALGYCAIAWNDFGVTRFQLPGQNAGETERLLLRRTPLAERGAPPPMVAEVITAVTRYCRGEAVDFRDVPIDLADQDAFFQQIYAALRRVGWGSTTTYGSLAQEAGAGQEAAREVGQAMAKNPVPLIIPCHRVLAAGGKLGGFSAPGGSDTKVRMLELEGVRFGPPKPAQQSLGF